MEEEKVNDAAGSASKKLGLTTRDLSLADGDVALASKKGLCALGRNNPPEAFRLRVAAIRRCSGGTSRILMRGKGEHDSKDCEDEGEDKEEGFCMSKSGG